MYSLEGTFVLDKNKIVLDACPLSITSSFRLDAFENNSSGFFCFAKNHLQLSLVPIGSI